jgi:hypothetical protein
MMPYSISKIKGRFQVKGPSGIHAKGTTKQKALAQVALLKAKEHNPDWEPTGKKARKYT